MGVPGIDRYRFAVLAVCLTLVLGGCASAVRWENTADGVQGQTYTVRRGDTLYSIAFRHQLDYRSLARWNGIGGSYLIKPGQTLRLYPSGNTQQPDTTAARSPSPTTRKPPTLTITSKPRQLHQSLAPPPICAPRMPKACVSLPQPAPRNNLCATGSSVKASARTWAWSRSAPRQHVHTPQ